MGLRILQILFIATFPLIYAQRLPGTTVPISYDIVLTPNLEEWLYTASVRITARTVQTTSTITLHAKNYTTMSPPTIVTNAAVEILSHGRDSETDFLTLYLNTTIQVGTIFELQFNLTNQIAEGNVGFYRATFVNGTNTHRMAVTHFEATNARNAFPCYDQPDHKATFRITFIRRSDQITTSNMPVASSLPSPPNVQDIHETSLLMPTYLVAFMVSDNYAVDQSVVNNVNYRTFGRPELIDRGDGNYSLQVAPLAIQHMENFTEIAYPIEKMDQVAVPNEFFKIGAMENWGMVTYRERYLMYNTELSTAEEKQRVAAIISHEFAHQWFGDLVTPEWWQYIWLNEGFATYFEQFVTSLIEPNWNLMAQFVTSVIQPALSDDSLPESRAMTRLVNTTTEIAGIYDKIVYEKAGSVIRMARNFLGEDAFRAGLTNYLTQWMYGNVNPSRLYDAWQNALDGGSNLNVRNIMTSWESKPGYPLVTVRRNYANGSINLSQERFFVNANTPPDVTSRWIIPVDFMTSNSNNQPIIWLNDQTREFRPNVNISSNQWVIFNRNSMGFYRVNYDNTNWRLIINQLRSAHDQISIENRAQLIDDVFNLARAQKVDYNVALDLGEYIFNETNYVPIAAFVNVFSYLDKMATGLRHHEDIKQFGREILAGYFGRVASNSTNILPNDHHLTKLTKAAVNTWLCNFEHAQCRSQSAERYVNWVNVTNAPAIQPDMQSFVLCNGVRVQGGTVPGQQLWTQLLNRYRASREDTEKGRIATALGCSNNTALFDSLFGFIAVQESDFTATDKLNAFTSIYTSNGANGVNAALIYLRNNFTSINNNIGSVSRIISDVASRITTQAQLNSFDAFVTAQTSAMTNEQLQVAQKARSTIEWNLAWIAETSSDFEAFFAARRGGSSHAIASTLLIAFCAVLKFFY